MMGEPASHPDRLSPKGEREREFHLKRARPFSFVLPLIRWAARNEDGLRIRLEQTLRVNILEADDLDISGGEEGLNPFAELDST